MTATSAAIVLAGGQSRRMGTDKASLVVDGVSMLERVRSVVEHAGIGYVVMSGPDGVPDAPQDRGQGPMAGIVSGWSHLQASEAAGFDPVLVLSCDLVALTPAVIADLVVVARRHEHGAIAVADGELQPLIAAYRPQALDQIADAFASGERSVRRCFSDWDLGKVTAAAATLADADTPADLANYDVQWPAVDSTSEPT